MNKTDLVKSISELSGLNKKQSESALNAFIASVQGALKGGDKVVLVGFGTFGTKERSERTGRNPQTGKEITIPACMVPFFKAGKSLKDMVNHNKKSKKRR